MSEAEKLANDFTLLDADEVVDAVAQYASKKIDLQSGIYTTEVKITATENKSTGDKDVTAMVSFEANLTPIAAPWWRCLWWRR